MYSINSVSPAGNMIKYCTTLQNETNIIKKASIGTSIQLLAGSYVKYIKVEQNVKTNINYINEASLIYPNPASDFIRIEFNTNKNTILSISDITGKTELQRTINESVENINVSKLSKRIHILKIFNNEEYKIIKFIKE